MNPYLLLLATAGCSVWTSCYWPGMGQELLLVTVEGIARQPEAEGKIQVHFY
jgi:F0F1-type ATP synthase membrane subunit c/vacuolar-type H+-ATPase subunit K